MNIQAFLTLYPFLPSYTTLLPGKMEELGGQHLSHLGDSMDVHRRRTSCTLPATATLQQDGRPE